MAQLSDRLAAKLDQLKLLYNIKLTADQTHANLTLADSSASESQEDAVASLSWIALLAFFQQQNQPGVIKLTDYKLTLFQSSVGLTLQAQAEMIFLGPQGMCARVRVYRTQDDESLNPTLCVAEATMHIELSSPKTQSALSSSNAVNENAVAALTVDTSSEKTPAMEAKRRKIFDGACEVIGKEGYAATTMRKVAKAAGIPLSTMYQYIDTKEDLLFMITQNCMQEIFDYMTHELKKEGDAVTKIKHAVNAYVKYVSKNRRYINLAYRETRSLSSSNREKIFNIERSFTRLWEEIIIIGNQNQQFSAQKSRLAANMAYFFCNIWALRYWSVQEYSEEEVSQYLVKFIMGGLTADDSL